MFGTRFGDVRINRFMLSYETFSSKTYKIFWINLFTSNGNTLSRRKESVKGPSDVGVIFFLWFMDQIKHAANTVLQSAWLRDLYYEAY